ncbi:MAG: diacylglycerol kinase family lipid kinase [Lachnospiraceae bacterium]|nr:diacylglycerol kinase family lipid kinase [Lachnospiraceae bacterium]
MKLLFIFNPRAGKETVKNRLGDIIELFSSLGHVTTVMATSAAGDAVRFVREMDDGYDRVICAGGDGTLDEVVSGMYGREHKVPIGYIPAGSTNDFAVSLGIPVRVMDAAKASVSDHIFDCDLGLFNGRPFVYVAAFGAFTEVSYETPQNVKNVFGHTAYIMEALKRLGDIRSASLKVTTDSMTIEDDFIYGMITNSSSVGGIKNITGPAVDLSDGLFEVTLVRNPKTPADMNAIITGLMNREYSTDALYSFKAEHITFEFTEPVSWTLDGEFGGEERNVEIRNMKGEMRIAVK